MALVAGHVQQTGTWEDNDTSLPGFLTPTIRTIGLAFRSPFALFRSPAPSHDCHLLASKESADAALIRSSCSLQLHRGHEPSRGHGAGGGGEPHLSVPLSHGRQRDPLGRWEGRGVAAVP